MLLRYFGLSDDPFGVTPEPRYLYESNTHREALASLKYGFYSNRGFTALIAPPGLGKTTLLHRFLGDTRDVARSVYLFNIDSRCEPAELMGSILHDLGVTPARTSTEMREQLNEILVEEARAGRVVAIVIDEAQNLSDAALEAVRLLSNFETARAKLVHIVLAGQPQLSDKLMQPSLVQLRQRITTICHIDPLSASETGEYINHRLRLAGYRGESLFTSDAIELITKASHGIPRTINTLCFNSLSICRAMNRKQVERSMVEEAIGDLQLVRNPVETVVPPVVSASVGPSPDLFQSKRVPSRVLPLGAAAVALLGISVLGIFGFWGLQSMRLHKPSAVRSADSSPAPRAVSSPAAEGPSAAPVAAPTAKAEPFKVKVERHQTLRDIAMKYLGEFNEKRLSQIRSLNPSLVNPNHIVPGQSIWLPGPPASNLAESAVTSTDARSLP